MSEIERHRIEISGAVQGVGFRPHVYRLASEFKLGGWACNSLTGLIIEVEGTADACADFLRRIRSAPPANASVHEIVVSLCPVESASGFGLKTSHLGPAGVATEILPDLATCPECVREIFDPANRRHHYPFTNCTQCGPRFSIVQSLPWDRERTTMSGFTMCPECLAEFESPADRRFHAQPNACPKCGPQLAFTNNSGRIRAICEEAMERAAEAIEAGQIVVVKGIGGFQLLADARSADAISTLRARKHRPAKPFALMLPDIERVRLHCELSELEERLLRSAQAPIVILQRHPKDALPSLIAPGNPTLGVMLPYSPLHHLLMRRLGFPVVATSGNISNEPLCIDNEEVFHRLSGIADAFLIHDRPIARPVDDSVVRAAASRELTLRLARGCAPFSIGGARPPVLAIGGDQKTALSVSGPGGIRCGQHLGDLGTEAAQQVFTAQCRDFPELCGVQPEAVACDLHPDFHGARWAGLPLIHVQHHHAHIAACLAEHAITDEVLGVAWDGTGYGTDGTFWGGEFLFATQADFQRIAHLRPFRLPGGELAVRQPRYAALGLLLEAGICAADTSLAEAFTTEELAIAQTQVNRGINAPLTSSAGRLFDAVAALLGIRWSNEFEAQAAMELEFAAGTPPEEPNLTRMCIGKDGVINWEPMIRSLLAAFKNGVAVPAIAAEFLEVMAESIIDVARQSGKATVALSGGCFQNVRLLEITVAGLRAEGFTPVWPQRLPPNDGGLALGQAVIAAARLRNQTP